MKLSAVSIAVFALANAEYVLAAARPQTGNKVAPFLHKRAQRCGPGFGSCSKGECCSGAGYCGTTREFCEGSQCQLEYSDSCDTYNGPPGKSTEGVSRDRNGNVPYGTIITKCTTPGKIALTFDDGPWEYTPQLLDILDDLKVKATFFIAGDNRGKGRIDDESKPWPEILRRMHDAGHQLASHTWTHRNLNQVNRSIQLTEMVYNEMAFRNIFGWFPAYMRPPYLECSQASGCTALMGSLGYHIITNNIDTKDYENDDAALIQTSKNRFSGAVSSEPGSHSYIVLAHDVHYQTVTNLTKFMVNTAKDRGYKLTTVGDCLGDKEENWYRRASDDRFPATTVTRAPTATASRATTTTYAKPTQTSIISPDQKCGGDQGYTCVGSKFGNCCSFYGFCGSTKEYCGTGCSPDFGRCDPVPGGVMNSTNGLCGAHFSATCANYGSKNCCSQYGYCGSDATHCGAGCQKGFGKCN